MKLFVTHIDSFPIARFFMRLRRPLKELGIELVVICGKLSIIKWLRASDIEVRPLRKSRRPLNADWIENTHQRRGNLLSMREASLLAASVWNVLGQIHEKRAIDGVLAWNGLRVADYALAKWGELHNLPMAYMEIGNFPGKLFVDPWGVNAVSRLARDSEYIGSFSEAGFSFLQWKQEFLKSKEESHVVPQSVSKKKPNYHFLLDSMGFWFLGIPRHDRRGMAIRMRQRILLQLRKFRNNEFLPMDGKCVLFPLQVTSDSQLILFSKLSLYEALDAARALAKERQLPLVVRIHPAECDSDVLKQVYAKRDDGDFMVSEENTYQLIKRSELVVTINSTVGLEAMLLGVPVEILGEAFYSRFSATDVGKYIDQYLINIDFFRDSSIPSSEVIKILNRMSLPSGRS